MTAGIDYTPAPTVGQFIQSEMFYNFIVGPVGSSKTTGILFKILYHAMRQRQSPQDGIRRTRFVVVRNTMPQLKDTTIKSFMTWFKPGQAGKWVVGNSTFLFRFQDVECEVLFRPLDSPDDVQRVLSLEVTGAILDEFVEIPQAIVEALSGRCGRYPAAIDGGPSWHGMWGASNPGNEDNWWYDWLYEPWADVIDEDGRTIPGEEAKRTMLGYFEQPGGFESNAENLDNLPGGRAYYSNLAIGKSHEWIQQFINTKWGFSLKGTPVYKVFKPDIHVSKVPLEFNPYLPVIIGFDAGLTPSAIIGQQDSHGRVLILRELISDNMGAKRFCQLMLKPLLRRECPDNEIELIGDPAFTQRAQTDEKRVKDILEKELPGVTIRAAPNNSLVDRVGAVEGLLTLLTDVGPAYLVDPSCKTLIRGFSSGYQYAVNSKGVTAAKPDKTGPGAKYTHPHDANQYLCMGITQLVRAAQKMKKAKRLMAGTQTATYNAR